MEQLFNRAGQPHEPNATTDTGAPAYRYRAVCARCGGTGHHSFNLIDGTRCYGCNGLGKGGMKTDRLYTQAQLDAMNARLQVRRAREEAKRNAERQRIEAERAAIREQFKTDQAPALLMLQQLVDGSGQAEFWTEFRDGILKRAYISEAQAALIQSRHAEMILKREAAVRNHHFGEVGQRAKRVRLVVNKSIHIGTNTQFYPPKERYLVLMTTEAGAALAWFTDHPVREGDAVAAFTVKEHADYKGAPQTVVQRVKFEEAEEPAVA